MRRAFVALLSAALLALGVGASSASAGAPPAAGSPGCNGLAVAAENHSDGHGPGFTHGGESPGSVPAAIAEHREICSVD